MPKAKKKTFQEIVNFDFALGIATASFLLFLQKDIVESPLKRPKNKANIVLYLQDL